MQSLSKWLSISQSQVGKYWEHIAPHTPPLLACLPGLTMPGDCWWMLLVATCVGKEGGRVGHRDWKQRKVEELGAWFQSGSLEKREEWKGRVTRMQQGGIEVGEEGARKQDSASGWHVWGKVGSPIYPSGCTQ